VTWRNCVGSLRLLKNTGEAHLGYLLFFFFDTLTHRIALLTTFSDLKSRQMDYSLVFYHWAVLFGDLSFFSTASKMFRLVWAFYPENRKNLGLRRQNISTPQ
jgi:hypothetical protein